MSTLINHVGEIPFPIGEITMTEIKIQVIDCRSSQKVKKAKVKKIIISKGEKTFEKEFSRNDAEITNTGIRGSMEALKKLVPGAAALTPINQYNDTWRGHYNTYWQTRLNGFTKLSKGDPSPAMLQYIINEYNWHRVTTESNVDADSGILRVQVPTQMLEDNSVTIEVGFWDFPVVLERLNSDNDTVIKRASETQTGTNFKVSWNGIQNSEWGGNFGWQLSLGSETASTELKVSETITVVSDENSPDNINSNCLSVFLDSESTANSPHFVLLAMQWCQPVWDGIDDPNTLRGYRSNDKVFVNKRDNDWIKDLNMHIVSKHQAGDYDVYGHYYGLFDTSGNTHRYNTKNVGNNRPHQGVDLYSGLSGNDPVFAVHGGVLSNSDEMSGYGNASFLSLIGGKTNPRLLYAHLSALPTKTYVMAGESFGNCGRTGYSGSPSHMHFELWNNAGKRVEFNKINTLNLSPTENIDNYNAALFQGNKLPILLPCHSHGWTALNCKFGEGGQVKSTKCWAVREFPYTDALLKYASHTTGEGELSNEDQHPSDMPIDNASLVRYICPHILNANAHKLSQMQAKMRFLFENYLSMGIIDSQYLYPFSLRYNPDNATKKSNGVDGKTGPGTKDWVVAIIQTYQTTLEEGDTNKTTTVLKEDTTTGTGKTKIVVKSHVDAFITRYTTSGQPISEDSLVDGAFTWFQGLNFNEISWNS